MKIERIDCLHADGGTFAFDFVKVTADTGLIGWSEYNETFGGIGVTAVIEGLAPLLIGQDPRPISSILATLHAHRRVVQGGIAQQAIAAIENALWDLKAKALGIPVYELLGGPVRTEIPLYWSHCGFYRVVYGKQLRLPPVNSLDDLKACAAEAVAAGYAGLKTNLILFGPDGPYAHNPGFARGENFPSLNAERRYASALADQLAAMREGAPDADLMLDLNFNYKIEGFVLMAKAAEQFGLTWVEIDSYSPAALRDIRARTTVPVASGEALFGRRQYRPFLNPPCMDVLIVDLPWNGLSESLAVAQMADTAEVNVAPHNFCGPLSTVMSAHFSALIPNFRILEYDPDHAPWYDELLSAPLPVKDGKFHLSDRPGWGFDVNEAALAAHPAR